jgi:Raf kinase inhibitor-like YbhB/YbcL family protein
MKISSPVFKNNAEIPKKYTCMGENINPALLIDGVPKEAKSLALIADDPDAPIGTWIHWLAWNINPRLRDIDENSVPAGAVQGTNSFGEIAYGGPCPSSGKHRYLFKLYALNKPLELVPGSFIEDLEKAMGGHIIDYCDLIGFYKK